MIGKVSHYSNWEEWDDKQGISQDTWYSSKKGLLCNCNLKNMYVLEQICFAIGKVRGINLLQVYFSSEILEWVTQSKGYTVCLLSKINNDIYIYMYWWNALQTHQFFEKLPRLEPLSMISYNSSLWSYMTVLK